MSFIAAFVALAGLQGTPPPDLEATAVKLRTSGANVIVGRAEFGEGWEIWFDESRRVHDQAFAPLSGIRKLGAVRFLGGGFGDDGVAKLRDLPDLHLLVLFSDRLTDLCMTSIAKLKSLVKLDLSYAKLTKTGLSRLSELPRLKRLYLYNSTFSDAAARTLSKIKSLELLDLPSNLQAQTIEFLRQSLPSTRIVQRKQIEPERKGPTQ